MWEAAGYLAVHWDVVAAVLLAFPEMVTSHHRKKEGTLTSLAAHPFPANITFTGAVPVDPTAAFPMDTSARCGERWEETSVPGQGSSMRGEGKEGQEDGPDVFC